MLIEFKDLNLVEILLEFLSTHINSPIMICQILSNLTNLALNDLLNIKVRLHGAALIGRILMENCPALIKENKDAGQNGVNCKVYSEDQNEDVKIKHEI